MADEPATPTPGDDAPTADDEAAAQAALADATDAERERYNTLTVVQALVEVMRLCTVVAKGSRNEEQRFNFRGIDDVVNVVGPALRKVGVLAHPLDLGVFTYTPFVTKNNANGISVVAELTYRFHGPQGDTIDIPVRAETADYGDKGTSKVYSVALRTALLQTLMLPTHEIDPDAQSYDRGSANQTPPPPDGYDSWDAQKAEWKRLLKLHRALPEDHRNAVTAWLRPLGNNEAAIFKESTMTVPLAKAWALVIEANTPAEPGEGADPAPGDDVPAGDEPPAESPDAAPAAAEDAPEPADGQSEPDPSPEPPEDAERPFEPAADPEPEPEAGPKTADDFTNADTGVTDFVELGAAAGHNKAMVLRIARDLAKRSDMVEPVKVDEIDGPLAALLRAELAKALPKA